MEFTDPVVPHNEAGGDNEPGEKKDFETISRLEEEIDSAYTMIENKFASFWSSASRNAQDLHSKVNLERHKEDLIKQMSEIKNNIGSTESAKGNENLIQEQIDAVKQQVTNYEKKVDLNTLTSKANQALDSLDSKLELVEQQAGKFVSLFASFFSSVVSVSDPSNDQRGESKSIMPNPAYGSTRFDSELLNLHTHDNSFLSTDSDVLEDRESFDVDGKSKEISTLLQRYPDTLEKTMNKLVPVQVSYKEFWYRYFVHEKKLKLHDQARKELLAAEEVRKDSEKNGNLGNESQEEDEEEFTWDDDDEDAVDKEGPL